MSTLREDLENLAEKWASSDCCSAYDSDDDRLWASGVDTAHHTDASELTVLLAAHPVEQADRFRNVKPGLYRNDLGAELHVVRTAMNPGHFTTLAGDIAIAEARDDLFGTSTYLVTLHALQECGYELITEDVES